VGLYGVVVGQGGHRPVQVCRGQQRGIAAHDQRGRPIGGRALECVAHARAQITGGLLVALGAEAPRQCGELARVVAAGMPQLEASRAGLGANREAVLEQIRRQPRRTLLPQGGDEPGLGLAGASGPAEHQQPRARHTGSPR
jgi:hypothetical protein